MKWLRKQLDRLAMWWLKPTISTPGEIIFTNGNNTRIKNINIECCGIQFRTVAEAVDISGSCVTVNQRDTK